MIIFGVILSFFYAYIARRFIVAAREVKRINSTCHSPIYDQFSSVLSGLSTIRAFHRTEFYMDRMFGLIDDASKGTWALTLCSRWMGFRMGILGGQGYRGDEAMVKFMDVRVKAWDVQESMGVVEQDLPDENAKNQVPHNFLRSWQADVTILGRLA